MEEFIRGAHKLQHLRIWSFFRPDDIRKQATQSSQRWNDGTPLSVFDGVPVALKDCFPVTGHRLCTGSNIESCEEQTDDGAVARKLREADDILVGLTVMTEGGVSPMGYTVSFDGPFNPYNLSYFPSSSSSGAAVAVASGLAPMAVERDGWGSVWLPAAMSDVNGLAVTFGRIVSRGDGDRSSMTKNGPLAGTIVDVSLVHLVLGGVVCGSVYSELIGEEHIPPPHLEDAVDDAGMVLSLSDKKNRSSSNNNLKGIRLGIYWDHFQHADPEIYAKCLASVRHMERMGAELVNITIPHMRELSLSHGITILSEFALHWDARFFDPNYKLEDNTKIVLALGRTVTAVEALAAGRLRAYGMKKVCDELFRGLELDAIVSPMLGEKVPKPLNGYRGYGESDTAKVYRTMRFVPLANLLGLPGLSVPIGYEEDTGLPIGFQFMGDAWSEHKLIRLGMQLEQSTLRRRPPAENFFDTLETFL